jgi:hypothetical protein
VEDRVDTQSDITLRQRGFPSAAHVQSAPKSSSHSGDVNKNLKGYVREADAVAVT